MGFAVWDGNASLELGAQAIQHPVSAPMFLSHGALKGMSGRLHQSLRTLKFSNAKALWMAADSKSVSMIANKSITQAFSNHSLPISETV
ncbi:hypothetical protein E5D57_013751 [Metarhizium anisopliae]|nr:hypothetical protein E5D57_013751 [Metarhizium anisopliae]